MYDRQYLDNRYSNILTQNRDKILHGGVCNSFLANAENDERMSLVLLIGIAPDISNNIVRVIDDLRKIEPDMYLYPMNSFHITVIDLLKGEKNQ